MIQFIEDSENTIKKKDDVKDMAEESQEDPKNYINPIFAGTVLGLTHPICPPEDQMFQLFTQAPFSTGYNGGGGLQLVYPMDPQMILLACEMLTNRHDITRTSYHMEGGAKAVKRISGDFMGDVHVLYSTSPNAGPIDAMGFSRPFQLGVAPMRFTVTSVQNDRQKSSADTGQKVVLNFHHIIADGDGQGIAIAEFETICSYLFRGFSAKATMQRLSPITVQFQDYAYWLASLEARGLLLDELAVWFSQITSASPTDVLDIPIDFPRQRAFIPVGTGIKTRMDQDLLDPILKVAATTPYSLVFTFFTIALCRLTQKSNQYVAIAYGTRPIPSLYPLIGSFLNMLPAHFSYYASESLGTCLDRMSFTQLAARKNALAPFLTINNYVRSYNNPPFDPSRNPVYQSMLDLVPGGDEFNEPGMPGVLDFFGLAVAPGGQMTLLESCWNSTVASQKTAVSMLNLAKSIALISSNLAAVGPESLHSTPIPELLPDPELGIKGTQGANLGTFVFKLYLLDEEHADAKDEDCEISIISGPEPEGVPDEYDFFRRSKRFLRQSAIMRTVDVSHAFAPQFMQPPLVKKKKGMALMLPTPQSTEVDPNYKKEQSEPQLEWVPTAATAAPSQEKLEGKIKFFDDNGRYGMITPADESGDVIFTASSIPMKERPTKKKLSDLTDQKVYFSLVHGINDKYAAGITFLDSEGKALINS